MKIACGQQSSQLMTLLVPENSTMKSLGDTGSWQATIKQLQGKVIGFPTPVGSGFQTLFAKMLEQAGVDNVTYVNLGTSPSTVAPALKNGSVDLVATFPATTQYVQASGDARELIFLPDGPPLYGDLHFASWAGLPQWIDDNPETVEKFCAAIDKATSYIQDESNYAELTPTLSESLGVDAAMATRVLDDGVFDAYNTELTAESWDKTVQAFVDAGVIDPSPVPSFEEVVLQQTQ